MFPRRLKYGADFSRIDITCSFFGLIVPNALVHVSVLRLSMNFSYLLSPLPKAKLTNLQAVIGTVSGWQWGDRPLMNHLTLRGRSWWGWACCSTAYSPLEAAGHFGPDCPWSVFAHPSWSCPLSLPAEREMSMDLKKKKKSKTQSSVM